MLLITAASRLIFRFALLLQTAEETEVEVLLARVDGSLGFNIMGGTEVYNIRSPRLSRQVLML